MRVGPVPPDETVVPVKDGLWCDEERTPPLTWDQAGEQGDERPVGPAEARPPDLAAQHRQLVAQDEYLGVLREGIGPAGPDEPERPTEDLVEEGEGHGRAAWPNASELVKSQVGVIGPYRRCDQDNLIAQLKGGVRALHAPVNTLNANWAYMAIAALAWSIKAWCALLLPVSPRWADRHNEQRRQLLRMDSRTFLPAFIEVPCQVVKGARQVRWRAQAWGLWLGPFFRLLDAL